MPNIPTFENVGGFSHVGTHGKKGKTAVHLNFFQRINLPFFVVLTLLVLYGLIVCASAVTGNSEYSFARQLMGLGMGIVVFVSLLFFNYKFFERLTIPLLVVSVALILSPHLPVIGVEAMGARSWVKIGMQFQPGEIAKVTVILFAASLITQKRDKLGDLKEYCKTIGMLAIPFVCILTQPDLGTGLVYFIISAVVVTVGGARGRYVIGTILLIVVAFLALLAVDEVLKTQASDGTYEYKLLKNYQRNRLFVFMNQDSTDSSGEGYNLAQALIAIGSGGAFGKG